MQDSKQSFKHLPRVGMPPEIFLCTGQYILYYNLALEHLPEARFAMGTPQP